MQYNKPITLLAEEFQRNLVSLINNSGLPYFAIRGILKDCVEEATLASQKQLSMDKKNYGEYLRNVQQEEAKEAPAE